MRDCARITQSVQKTYILTQQKSDQSPVTIADYAVQAYIAHAISMQFPTDGLVAEESSATLLQNEELLAAVTAEVQNFEPDANPENVCQWLDHGRESAPKRFWVLDPVDGTKGFLRKMQYVTALALVDGGEVIVSVIGCPELKLLSQIGGLAFAALGQGAYWKPFNSPDQEISLHVSSEHDLSKARLIRSYEDAHTNAQQIEQFSNLAGIKSEPVRMDSQAKYTLLAHAEAEILLRLPANDRPNYRENIWDQAPAYRLVLEAGGEMTDRLGHRLDFLTGTTMNNNIGVVATNGLLHQQTLDILAQL